MNKRHIFYASLASLMMVSCAPKHYQLTNVERTRVIVDSRYDKNLDEAAVKFLEPFKRVNDSIMGPIVGQVARNMHANRPESNLSNLLADILVWSAKDYNEKAVLGIYNMGGIRADLTKGNVTYGDVLDVAPFENKICFITLTGEQMLTLFRQIAHRGGEVVPVMSIRLKMGLEADEHTDKTRIIIVKSESNAPVGLIVDEVREVVTLDETAIDEVIRDRKVDETYINGIGKNGDTLISLLDLNAVISDKDNS